MEKEHEKQLEKRVEQLELEVQLLKQQLTIRSEHYFSTKKTKAMATPHNQSSPEKKSPVSLHSKEVDWEKLIGRVWLPRVFIFVLLMGLVWGFKVVVDYGILTEPIRVVIGFTAAIGLFIIGERQVKLARVALGKILLVGAVGVLILTTFAMNVLYDMLPTIAAFCFHIIWVGIGIALANRHQSQVMAVLMAIIGYLIPFLVAGSGNVLAAVIYEIIFYASLVCYAIYKKFKGLFYTATSLLHIVYLALILGAWMSYDQQIAGVMAIGAIVQHAIIIYSVYQVTFTKLFPIPLVFTSFIVTTFWVKLGTLEADYLYVIYLISIFLCYSSILLLPKLVRKSELRPLSLSIASFSLFLLLVHTFENNENLLAASLLMEGIIALYLGCHFQTKLQKLTGSVIFFIGTLIVLTTHTYSIISFETASWIFFLITLYGLIHLTKHYYKDKETVFVPLAFGVSAGHILFLMRLPAYKTIFSFEFIALLAIVASLFAVFILINNYFTLKMTTKMMLIVLNVVVQLAVLTDFMRYVTNDLSENITTMSISFSWAFYAAASVALGVIYNKRVIRLLGIGLLMLTLAKLMFFDLHYVTIVVRAILFIGLGVIGMLLSRLLYVRE